MPLRLPDPTAGPEPDDVLAAAAVAAVLVALLSAAYWVFIW